MTAMKKILNIVVAVISCFCILIATTVPAFAEGSSEEIIISDDLGFYENKQEVIFMNSDGSTLFSVDIEEFNLDDYLIPYDLYMNPPPIGMFSISEALEGFGEGLAWNKEYAAEGLTCTSGGMYFLGLGLAADMFCYGVEGLADTLQYDVPVVFYQTVRWIYSRLSDDCLEELYSSYTSWSSGESFYVSENLTQSIADIINGMQITDSAGNLIDSALSIQEAYIAGVFEGEMVATIPLSSQNGYMQCSFDKSYKTEDTIYSVTSDNITFSYLNKRITVSNSITGTTLSMHARCFGNYSFAEQVRQISKWFYVTDAGCGPFWLCYSTTKNGSVIAYDAYPFYFENITSEYPMTFSGTGTILDGQVITKVEWDVASSSWTYTPQNGAPFQFPLEPITLLLTSTGILTTAGQLAITVDPAKPGTYDSVYVPPIPYVGNPAIGIPVTDTIVQDMVNTQTRVETDALQDKVVLDSPDAITTFLGGIVDYFSGIFDWLPVDFRTALDGVLITLQGIILLMAVVKIVDIIWP